MGQAVPMLGWTPNGVVSLISTIPQELPPIRGLARKLPDGFGGKSRSLPRSRWTDVVIWSVGSDEELAE